MLYRDFKGLRLSALGMGMMRLPTTGGSDGDIDEPYAAEILDYAYKNGINYFDTAWGYHDGNSELVAGRCLSKYPRENFYLASKFPGYDNSNMPKSEEIFERQLEKCQTPYFDFYLIHNVYEGNVDDYLDPKFGILEYFLKQKENGRIRHLGFSAHGSIDVIRRFLEVYGPHMEFCQLQINYRDWHFQNAEGKVALLRERGLPVWVMEPVRGGNLSTEKLSDNIKSQMKKMRPDESPTAWAFRFLQSVPGIIMVLSGMSAMDHVIENVKVWSEERPLTEVEFARLLELIDEDTAKGGVPCTGCHYCTPHCPKGLPIPEFMSLYTEHKIAGGGFLAPMAVSSMPKDKRPTNCISCRSCEKVCPQQIKISEVIAEFNKMLKMGA